MSFVPWELWIESRETEVIAWDSASPGWHTFSLGDSKTFFAYVGSQRVSIEGGGPMHPLMKRAIKVLLKQKPYVKDYKLEFDGYSPGTVEEFLYISELHEAKDKVPKFLFHGTSLYRWEKIRDEGLKPRSETGEEPVYGTQYNAKLGSEDQSYFSGHYGSAVRWAAHEASRDGSDPVVLVIDGKGIDSSLLRPDHDSRKNTWYDSLAVMDSVAYEGNILPQYIKLYKAWNKQTKQWEEPGNWLEPQDSLAKEILHPRTPFKDIPDSSAKFRWTKL